MKDTAHRQEEPVPQDQSNKKGIFPVKKRMISGVLAAVMLLSTAYAAEGSTPDGTAAADTAVSADAAEQTVKLVFKADTPLTGANGDMVTEILKNRLAALGYKDYTVTVSEDGTGITAAFPQSTQVSGLADYLVQPAAFTVSDADGKVWLTNEDLKQVTSSKGSKDSTGCIVMTLTTKGRQSLREATTDIASRDSDRKLYIKVDTIASPTISGKIDSSSVNIENNFTEQVAENYALLLNAGALPVTLTVSSAPAANDKPIDGDDNNGETTTRADESDYPDQPGHAGYLGHDRISGYEGSLGGSRPQKGDYPRSAQGLERQNAAERPGTRLRGADYSQPCARRERAGQHGVPRRLSAEPVVHF